MVWSIEVGLRMWTNLRVIPVGELYSVHKDPAGKVRFALCFPDVYEVGMSHKGSRILYQVLNDCDFVACEAYAPWVDAERALGNGESLYALSRVTRWVI